jgi:hypothetical protein
LLVAIPTGTSNACGGPPASHQVGTPGLGRYGGRPIHQESDIEQNYYWITIYTQSLPQNHCWDGVGTGRADDGGHPRGSYQIKNGQDFAPDVRDSRNFLKTTSQVTMAQHLEHRYYDVLEQYFTKSIENAETFLFDQDMFDQKLWGLEDRYGVPFEVRTSIPSCLFLFCGSTLFA